ncbi:MAG: integrase core domain-containing protein, partial [Nitrospinota bacterium]|nr:integrase core domain-containing protein [Nitrospinota bacterium]
KVLVERWRQLYNRVRPRSALGYRPPVPVAIEPLPPGIPTLSDIEEQRLT